MDANRFFEEMHNAMMTQKSGSQLLLAVKYQDTAGNDAYIELHRNTKNNSMRIFYSTMGRKHLNFQLLRRGWQLCHNERGELTGSFLSTADELIKQLDFHAFYRDETFDSAKAARIMRELELCSGAWVERRAPSGSREDFCVTFDSFVGAGAHWSYSTAPDDACLTPAAIIYWLAEYLAGIERRALQASPQAEKLAKQWEAEAAFAKASPLSRQQNAAAPSYMRQNPRTRQRPAVQNERWQSILAVLSTV